MGCLHKWIPNGGRGGEPEFKVYRNSPHFEPVTLAQCRWCKATAWYNEQHWQHLTNRRQSK